MTDQQDWFPDLTVALGYEAAREIVETKRELTDEELSYIRKAKDLQQ